MTSLWKIAIAIACVAVICGAAILWRVQRGKAVERKKLAEAASLSRTRAEQGDVRAQSELASMYFYGRGVPQDYAEAARWSRKAADRGYAIAQDAVGVLYYEGKGVPQDYAEAVRWYRKAADQGYAKAQYNLGYMCYKGQGVPQDYAEAGRLVSQSRSSGLRESSIQPWHPVLLRPGSAAGLQRDCPLVPQSR